MERVIPVTIRDKRATAPKDALYVCGNSDFSILFDFDSEWDEYEVKTARFRYGGTYMDVVFSGNECPVPVISDTHSFDVGVYAGNLKTSTPAYVSARKSILCGAGSPSSPSPDVYAQIMERLNSIEGGSVAPEVIAAAVEAYMEAHDAEDVIELIETITLDEEMAIERSEEPDGTPYAFKRIVLMFEATGAMNSGNINFRSGSTIVGLGYLAKKESESTSALYLMNDCLIDSGRWVAGYMGGWTTNGNGVFTGNYNRRRWLQYAVKDKPTLTRVDIPALPAGTKIEIWGVRTNA